VVTIRFSFCPSLLAISALIAFSAFELPTGALAVDQMANAMQLYKQDNFTAAQTAIDTELKAQPGNGAAHYLAGLIFLKNGALANARNHFEDAVRLDPTGTPGIYGKRELDLLKNVKAVAPVAPAPIASAAGPGNAIDGKAYPTVPLTKQQLDLQKSVQAMAQEADEEIRKLEVERKEAIGKIEEATRERASNLDEQMRADIYNLPHPRRSGTWRSDVSDGIRQDYTARIAADRDNSKRQEQEVSEDFQRKIDTVNESVLSSEKSFLSPGSSHVRLMPTGTNLHVHNYQTEDEPSGHEPTLLAPPTKALKIK
jgi:tetratricopeptide (TPR) repeat protein